ncbi:S-adenosyl-L-methionine-dependent methyltransferase [Tilletiaria anomala UBC 951]|uniref:S-adenosyl-L-methionine-dependent methyltransferase n=1 Tax=Tilletiaria anomala (strain ATCC 24038 / CBS 436.72 / UBC 951) TaxID=1037660 RepID=A0A066WPQ8_TILAU|nr:S-adenosyl-L-methionine-dependent methyltransferase [Tilletiaria anomala UBC 951]KDN52610.1 S-adenosyl-L-methionine-dependent methyltransferase [Tilletiaria anomala UBC 951]
MSPASVEVYHRSDDAELYRENASFVYSDDNTAPVLQLLGAEPGDAILDVGCGSGELTVKVATLASKTGTVLGVDASEDMISKARGHEPSSNFSFEVVDCHELQAWLEEHGKQATFDKVFSSAALHWMNRSPSRVATGMRSAIKKGGVLALEMGGAGNVSAVRSLLRRHLAQRGVDPSKVDPWYFPTVKEYTAVLESAGFQVEHAALVVRPTPLPERSGIRGWLRTFAGPFLNALKSDVEREQVVAAVEKELVDAATSEASDKGGEENFESTWFDASSGQWTAPYVRLRVRAIAH